MNSTQPSRRLRHVLWTAVLLSLFATFPLTAQTSISSPTSIVIPGSYQLANNLVVTGGPALEIQSDGVHLDLNGFVIRVNDPSSPVVEVGDHGGVRITNGFLSGGSIAVRVSTLSTGNSLDIDDVMIDGFQRSGIWVDGGGGTVRVDGSTVRSAPNANSGEAVRLINASGLVRDSVLAVSGDAMHGLISERDSLHVADNLVRINDFSSRAVRLVGTGPGSQLQGNILQSPGIAMWVAFGSGGSQISENLMQGIRGILFEGTAEGHTVDWNHFSDSAEGVVFTLGVGGDNVLSNNRCLQPFGSSCVLAHHQVIWWPWGWHDLGGNHGH